MKTCLIYGSLKGKQVAKQSDKTAMAVGFVIIVLSQNNRVCPVVANVSVVALGDGQL